MTEITNIDWELGLGIVAEDFLYFLGEDWVVTLGWRGKKKWRKTLITIREHMRILMTSRWRRLQIKVDWRAEFFGRNYSSELINATLYIDHVNGKGERLRRT